jgi:hypothetical protein
MNENQPIDHPSDLEGQDVSGTLIINQEVRRSLRELCNWMRFMAVITVLSGCYGIYSAMRSFAYFESTVALAGIQIIVSIIVTYLLFSFLLRFINKTERGLRKNDFNEVEFGAQNMKNYYMTSGIITILMLTWTLLVVLRLFTKIG